MNKNKLVALGMLMKIKKIVGNKLLLQTKKSLLQKIFFFLEIQSLKYFLLNNMQDT
jgi:hypothetical protein